MSVRIIGQVLDDQSTTGAARMVLVVLANRAGDDGIAFESQATIARKAQVSEAHVREVLRDLEHAGLIETRKAKRGRARVNVYRLLLGPVDEPEYDRLPFVLEVPFTTAAQPRSSDADDRGSVGPTTADLSAPTRARQDEVETFVETKEPLAGTPAARKPNIAFDTLAAETQADPLVEGGKIGTALAAITRFVRAELEAEGGTWPDHADDRRQLVAVAVRTRAALYRRRWPNIDCTPTGLRDNWARVLTPPPGAASERPGRAVPPADLAAVDRELTAEERAENARRVRELAERAGGRRMPEGDA